VEPSELVELMTLMPSIVENSFSSGSATAEAMISGEAPGKLADTEITGVLKLGRAATGILKYATLPAMTVAIDSNTVITGRLIHSSESVILAQR
jgi:hypothetical protein